MPFPSRNRLTSSLAGRSMSVSPAARAMAPWDGLVAFGGVVRRKLLVHPIKIENAVDLPDQMIRRHHLVELKRIKELALSTFPPTHHESLPSISVSIQRNHRSRFASIGVLQHNRGRSGHCATIANPSLVTLAV
jgi:hypothetical protein